MKSIWLKIITAILIIMVIIILVVENIAKKQKNEKKIAYYNKQYEYCLNKEIYGSEVATLINKAIEQNEKNQIAKDDKGYYIENETNSIKIELKMITVDETYPMELIYKNNIKDFIKNFNIILFKCTNIEYHKKTGKIKKITLEQIEK